MDEFIRDVITKLTQARVNAGLTQAEVAERMGTKQASIARMENALNGSFSLRRIADYALACGVVPCQFAHNEPLEFHLISLELAYEFTLVDPQKPMTWKNFTAWVSKRVWEGAPPVYTVSSTWHWDGRSIAA